jgi:hypothetical protein
MDNAKVKLLGFVGCGHVQGEQLHCVSLMHAVSVVVCVALRGGWYKDLIILVHESYWILLYRVILNYI